MAQGASQAAVNDYLKDGLSAEQQAALVGALSSMHTEEFKGVIIATATCWLPGYVPGMKLQLNSCVKE
jgi:hypothetical protein